MVTEPVRDGAPATEAVVAAAAAVAGGGAEEESGTQTSWILGPAYSTEIFY